MTKRWLMAGLLGMAAVATGCSEAATAPQEAAFEVAAVVPRDGARDVDPGAPLVLDFTHAMQPGMEQHLAVHEGDISGPAVAGQWSWSADFRRLTFAPASTLKPQTTYTIHMTTDHMSGAGAASADHAQHHATPGGGMMGGTMMGSGGMMGSGSSQCLLLTSFTTA